MGPTRLCKLSRHWFRLVSTRVQQDSVNCHNNCHNIVCYNDPTWPHKLSSTSVRHEPVSSTSVCHNHTVFYNGLTRPYSVSYPFFLVLLLSPNSSWLVPIPLEFAGGLLKSTYYTPTTTTYYTLTYFTYSPPTPHLLLTYYILTLFYIWESWIIVIYINTTINNTINIYTILYFSIHQF